MVLLAVTADTWIVTGLGFGIVLALLFCLVYILKLFGLIMQKAAEPKAPKAEKAPKVAPKEDQTAPKASAPSAEPTDEGTKAAIAYALYLARDIHHDIPTAMISLHKHETAWNEKSIGMNNQGF